MMFFKVRNLFTCVFCTLLIPFSLSALAQQLPSQGGLDVDRLGAAIYTLPISAIDGVGGVKPNIAVLYNSQAPNGILGKGGSISGLSVIKRCQQTLVRDGQNKAISWTTEDRFCVDSQRLMLVSGTQGAADSQYRTEIDSGVVYTAKAGTPGNPDYFEATAGDGATLVFGASSNAKELGGATMVWALSQYQDVNKNTIQYLYEGTAADGLRIKRINYAFLLPTTTVNPTAYIEFEYKDREDPISKYVAGYEFRNNKLLSKINTYGVSGLLYRSYQFDVATSSGLAGYVSRWQSVKECTTLTVCSEATQFEWGRTQKNSTTNVIETKNIKMDFLAKVRRGAEWNNRALLKSTNNTSCCTVQAADINGNGVAEFFWIELLAGGNYSYMGTFDGASIPSDSPRYTNAVPYSSFPYDPDFPPLEFADINADGFSDLINPQRDTDYAGRRLWGIEQSKRTSNTWMIDYYSHRQVSNTLHNFTKPLDLDGDGFQEILGIDKRSVDFTLYRTGKNNSSAVTTPDYRGISGSTQSLHLSDIPTANSIYVEYRGDMIASGDFNNDGKKDLMILVKLGYPTTDKQVYKINWYELQGAQLLFKETLYQESKTPLETYADEKGEYRLREFVEFKSLKIIDINGDGLDDVAFNKNSVWMYAINKGNGFLPFVTIPNKLGTYAPISPTFIDVNNDGKADYIYGEYTYNSATGGYTNPSVYVRYWNSKIAAYDEPVLIRTTPDFPILFADMNGDGFVDIVENQRVENDKTKDAINIYGFTNNVGNATVGFQGVLDQDTIVSVTTGATVNASVDYQTLIKPKQINILSCSSGISGTTPCYDFLTDSQYKPLTISVVRKPNSLDGLVNEPVVSGSPYYYTKTNEPFLGLNNPYAGSARVSQYVAPLPIVTRVKINSVVSTDKKYYYEIMRTQSGGRGILGFEKTAVVDTLTGTKLETSWRLDWPFTGMPSSQVLWNKNGFAINEKDFTLFLPSSENKTVFAPYIFKTLGKTYDTTNDSQYQGRLLNVSDSATVSIPKPTISSGSASSSASSVSMMTKPEKIELIFPNEGSVINLTLGNSVNVSAVALTTNGNLWTNASGSAPKLKFVLDNYSALGEGISGSVPFSWTPTAQGIYAVHAEMVLDDGSVLKSRAAGINVIPQSGYPLITWDAGARNGNYYSAGAIINLRAMASDIGGSISKVSFYVNDQLVAIKTSPDSAGGYYRYDWSSAVNGVYKLRFAAQDDLGNISQSKTVEIYYGVSNSSNSASSSSVSSIYPQLSPALPSKIYTGTVGDDIYISSALWSASGQLWVNNDGTNAQALFFANDAYVGSSKAIGTWTIFKPKSTAAYEIIAAANLPDTSQVVSDKSVLVLKNDAAPSISLTSPMYWGSTFNLNEFVPISADVTLNATSISKVTFYANDVEIGTDFNFPYSIAWIPSSEGIYLIKAIVEDTKGNTAISTQRQIKYGLSLSSSSSSKAYVVPPSSSSSSSAPNIAEKIVLASPLPGRADLYGLGADVVLSAYVLMVGGGEWLDQNGKTARIDYYANGKLLTDLKQYGGTNRFWTPTATGNYSIKAVAYLDNNKTIEVGYGGVNIVKVGAPVVSLTSPSTSQTFMRLGDTTTFSAMASDPSNALNGVQFSINNELIGGKLVSSGSYTGTWTPVVAGNYQVSAIAMNSSYVKTTSPSVMLSVIDTATAELTKPTFLSVTGLENVAAGIDTDGAFTLRWSGSIVADYYVLTEGDTEIYKGVEFSKSLQLKLGTYNFKLKACQIKPARCSEDVLKTIKVNTANNGAVNNVVDLTIPSPDRQQIASTGQQFGLYAEAKTPTGEVWRAADGTAATMTYYANGIKLSSLTSDSSGALTFTELTQPGTYSITAEAILDDGTKVTSEVGTVTVRNNSAPIVNMISPVNLQRVAEGRSVKLSAQITDNENNIAQVMFLVNGVSIGKATTTTPYEMQWTPPSVGTYNISVRAIDSGGLQSQSPVRSLIVDALTRNDVPAALLSPDYSPLGSATKVLRAEGELGDILVLSPPNSAGISYNAFNKFVVGQPLKIINVEDKAAGTTAATIIVIDAQQLTLNNTFEIVGAAADVLLINSAVNGQIQCLYCSFINVGRVTLAAAQPSIPFSTTMTQVGNLVSVGEVSITTLKAPTARVEVLGKTIITSKNDSALAINTQQQARLQPNNEYVLDNSGDKLVGTGSVNLVSGQAKVDYSNFTVLDFTTDANTPMTVLDGNIRSGAIKVVTASSLTINSQLSTHSDLQASLLDKGEFKLANERIELITLDKINGDLVNNGTLISDDKIKLVATGNIRNNSTATVIANHIEAISAKDLTNMGAFSCPDSVCASNAPGASLITDLYLAAEGVIDNQNTVSGFTNLTLTAGKDLNNRFGGTIVASNIYLNSKAGSIRNGWATPYENLPESSWVLQPSAYTQQLSTFDKFILPNIQGSQTPAKKARTKEAYIVGDKVIINAYRHVENINPSLDVYRNGTATPVEDATNASIVSISAFKRLEVRAHGYILNSSASLSVDSDASDAMLLMAPQVHNERYFMLALGDIVNEQGVVIDKSKITQTTTSTTSTSLESRLYVYSPAGVIFSNAQTMFKFDEPNGITSLLNPGIAAASATGFENNTSYFIVENDMEFQGAGSLVRSKGVLLERENYYLKRTVVTKDLMCRPINFGRISIKCDKTVNTINRNPLGETVQETIERTIFAVSGRLFGTPANFIGVNENPLDKAKELFVEEYKKDINARLTSDSVLGKGTYSEKKFISLSTILVSGVDGPYMFTTANYEYLHPEQLPAANVPKETQTLETKSVWDIVTDGFASLKAKFLALLDEFEKGVQ